MLDSIVMRPARGLLALILLGCALFLLATLQYRWLGRLAEADARRMRASLEFAGNHFVADFDHDLLTRMYLLFGEAAPVSVPNALEERYHAWLSGARDPRILREIDFLAAGSSDLQRLDLDRHAFVPIAWPASLASVRPFVTAQDRQLLERVPPIVPSVPALVVPCGAVILHHEKLAAMTSRHLTVACPSFTILQLDRQRLVQSTFPELTRRYFGVSSGGDYQVAVANVETGEVIYRSERWPESRDFRADFEAPIFRLQMVQFPAGSLPARMPEGAWRLLVRFRGGSLAELVAAAHRRNVAVALAVLAILGGSAAALMIMLRRAERLQQQQLQFVAGITHELNTPLSAVTSAAENLADGIISDRDEVSRYGNLILKESRRLTDMVTQVLDSAGMQSGRRAIRPDDTDVAAIVSDAVEQCRWMTEKIPVRVDVAIAPDLPAVRGDADALTRAVQNLVGNAIRHGGDGGSVRVSAQREGDQIAIAVEDHGRGIASADLPHLFEPFFRGRGAGGVRGSGLGLTIVRQIVEAHHGRVVVDRERKRGAAFTIFLPAAFDAPPLQQMVREHA